MTKASMVAGVAALAMLTAAEPAVQAAQQDDALAALDAKLPGTLINDPTRLDWPVSGDAKVKSIRDSSIPGGAAMHVQVRTADPKQPWTVQASIPLTAGIDKGSDVVIGFYARTIEADTPDGKGRIGVRFQQNSEPYPGFGDKTLNIGTDWQMYEVTAKADRDIAKGDAIVSLQLAGAKQVLEIGQAFVASGATSLGSANAAPSGTASVPVPEKLAAKGTVINDPGNRNWGSYGPALTAAPIKVGLPGGTATHFTVAAAQPHGYDSGVAIPIRGAIHSGENLIVALIVRASPQADGGATAVGIRIQKDAEGYPGFGDHDLPIAGDWRMLQIPMQSDIDIPAGKGSIVLHLGGAAQTVDVGPVYVLHAGG
ncbi:hypothetical protein [Stakelama marina]|uniref:CBM-cenC domain-containing protein n=1 Tax=Stakelama marina TaxID=2826939 RepID=A0A8T4IBX4_9SPHN|nr:hypothetical protein [Stakelama marina]MBR0552528.1 hypothetical protein [Stakelama marina]